MKRKYEWMIDEAIQNARDLGFEIIHSREDRLLLDLDEGFATYVDAMGILANRYELVELGRYQSASGGNHWHVILSCRDQPFCVRVALQMALGSDRKRELLALAMFADGVMEPSVLFKPTEESKLNAEAGNTLKLRID